jgi:hypothetical protein
MAAVGMQPAPAGLLDLGELRLHLPRTALQWLALAAAAGLGGVGA